jgi:hypothetical protein
MKPIFWAVAVLVLLTGTAEAQTMTPSVTSTPVAIAPPGFRVLAKGRCLADPSASLGDGAEVIVSCAAPGAMVGSLVLYSIETTSDLTDVSIKRAGVTENGRVDFQFGSYTAASNPGTLTINFAVVQ